MLTALDTPEQRHAGFAAGADDYVSKPFQGENLLDRVRVWTRTLERLKAAEAARQETESWCRRIVETAQEGVWTIDAAGNTTFVNEKMAAMLGYTVDEMTGASMYTFMDEEARGLASANLERRRQGIAEQHEFRFQRKDGTALWTVLSTNPLYDGDGAFAGALALVTDATARRQAEEALRQAERNEDRLEGILLAAREVGHLLNNDLTIPVGLVEVLQNRTDVPAHLRGLIEEAASGLTRAQQHVRQFQRVVRIETHDTPMGPALDL
jgi:PAS domain S-box-containing protein